MNKQEILKINIDARIQEIEHYQINIDNYTMALEVMNDLPTVEREELARFAEQISNLLVSETFEQKKAKIMLTVLQKQVE